MKVPDLQTAEELLREAEKLNPGIWVQHNRVAGKCAKAIATCCDNLDENAAYVLGLLHDIGRREGIMDLRHILSGYKYMMKLDYTDSARICLTHSFPYKNVDSYNGENDCTLDETNFIQSFIDKTDYNDYDRLIQLCDALSFPEGPMWLEKRLVAVVLKKGFNDLTIPKWKSLLQLKEYFDSKTGTDIYKLLGIKSN